MKLFVNEKNELHQGTIYMNGDSTYEEQRFILDFLHDFAGCGKSRNNQVTHIGETAINDDKYKIIDIKINDESFRYLNNYRKDLPISFISWRV